MNIQLWEGQGHSWALGELEAENQQYQDSGSHIYYALCVGLIVILVEKCPPVFPNFMLSASATGGNSLIDLT